MAAVTHRVTTADTSNTPNASDAFTPAVNDLLVVFVTKENSDSTVMASGDLTSSIGGFTFTLIRSGAFRSSADAFGVFVSNALVSSAISQTVTIGSGSDPGGGSIISVYSVSGMSQAGSAAVRQQGGQSNEAASTTPAPPWVPSGNALTGNVCLGAIANSTNPAGLTQPSGWTESQDTGYTTGNVTGLETAFRNSGETGSTITWGSTSASIFASLIIELDISVAATPLTLEIADNLNAVF